VEQAALRQDANASAQISRSIVQLLARYTGRGPTKAKTVVDLWHALVVLEDALTTGEQSLVAAGEGDLVRRQRERFHRLMRDEAVAAVESATGRRVRVMLCDLDPEAGVAMQCFVFDGPAGGRG
jgi:uncharacterized protein YbcI